MLSSLLEVVASASGIGCGCYPTLCERRASRGLLGSNITNYTCQRKLLLAYCALLPLPAMLAAPSNVSPPAPPRQAGLCCGQVMQLLSAATKRLQGASRLVLLVATAWFLIEWKDRLVAQALRRQHPDQ